MRGQQLTLKELIISGFDKPILIETKDGLELLIEANFNFDTIMSHYSQEYLIDAIEVTRQIKVKMKLGHLMAQFKIAQNERQDVYTTRLNLSKSKLADNFLPPRIVRKLSWIDLYWPSVPFKPQLSKFCFISMENSYTDFHIDIGGASSWHHIIHGEQTFYLIEPTSSNLSLYESWLKSHKIDEFMFFNNADKIFKVRIAQGETIFIPSGWIYSTMTGQDTIAFGGYFLHSLNISTQLTINDFLQALSKPELEFPSYELTNWYAAPNILKLAKESLKNQPPKHLSEGIEVLIEKLRYWLHKSRSKRADSHQTLVPKAINCSKIIRDLNHCLRKNKKKPSKDVLKAKEKADSESASQKPKLATALSGTVPLNPEETKIKDLVNSSDASGSSNLKLTFNMKLAQDVIRSKWTR